MAIPKKEMKEKASKLLRAYHSVFNTPDGELVLNDLMSRNHFKTSSFNPEQRPMTTIYNEGARSVILQILNELKKDERTVMKMLEQGDKDVRSYKYT